MAARDTVTIVGAGLAGALLACYLGKADQRVVLYEKRPDPRRGEAERGRSINLALSTRGLHALGEVGLAEEVVRESILMRGRMIHHPDGSLAFQPYGKDDREALHSVSRGGLNRLLVEAAGRYPSVEMHFEHRCTGVHVEAGELELVHGDEVRRIAAEVIVGADGAYSAVRSALVRRERFDYSQEYLTHGYKELTIPAGPARSYRLEKHALHIWPRGSFMMIALPNADGSFTCTLFWPFEGPNSFAALKSEKDILAFFQAQFPDVVPLIPDLVRDFQDNPTSALMTVRCRPWHVEGRVVLLGDACHAVVPFLGQGMNAAFEDCSVLVQCLNDHPNDRAAAFADYEAKRKPHLDTLAELCVANFIEMRDRVGSRLFVWRKKLDVLLHALLSRWYLPLYTMIEFTRIPYADAVKRARRQQRIVTGVGLTLMLLLVVFIGWLCLRLNAWRFLEPELEGSPDAELLVVENLVEDGIVKRNALVRYPFRAGRAVGRDQLLVRAAGFFGRWNQLTLHRQRYLITSSGAVLDAHTGKILIESDGQVLDIRDERVYVRQQIGDDRHYFYQDLRQLRTVELPRQGVWDLPGVRSPDATRSVSCNKDPSMRDLPGPSIWLHRPGQQPRQLADGLSWRLSSLSSSIGGLPLLWLDDSRILTQSSNGRLLIVGVDGSQKPLVDIAELLGPKAPAPISPPSLERDRDGQIVYTCCSMYLIDVDNRSARPYEWVPLGHGFSASSRARKPLVGEQGYIIRYLDHEIGRMDANPWRSAATQGYLALAVNPMKSNWAGDFRVGVWSAQGGWQILDGWLESIPGWLDHHAPEE